MKGSHSLPSIELDLPRKLQDPEFRERFFLAEASAQIAAQLIKLRKRRNLSQAELAELAGTHQPAVSRAEQADYKNWSFNALRKLTNAMQGRLRVQIDAWEDVLAEYGAAQNYETPTPLGPEGESLLRQQRTHAPTSAADKGEQPKLSFLVEEERPNPYKHARRHNDKGDTALSARQQGY